MTDKRIVELFWARDEKALKTTEEKYGKLCHYIASNFLALREDIEECVNDALLALWNSIPPDRPEPLAAYISERVRNIAISKSRSNNAWKRGGQVQTVSDEALELVPDDRTLAEDYEARLAGKVINDFLEGLSASERRVFVMRYWFDANIQSIAEETGFSHSKIKSMLARLRKRLAEKLGKEGITV